MIWSTIRLGLDIGTTKGKWTPADATPLVQDEEGEPPTGDFSYIIFVGMLLYLDGNLNTEIAYVINSKDKYMLCPKINMSWH